MEFAKLTELLANLSKNPNRTYTQKYIDEKLLEIDNIWKKIAGTVDKDHIVEARNKFNELVQQIKKFLVPKESNIGESSIQVINSDSPTIETENNNQVTDTTMATFDIAQAAKVIPEFDGDFKKLSNFVNLLEFYEESLAENQRQTLLKFVLATKLTEKVRNRLIGFAKPQNIAALKKNLQDAYKPRLNLLTIQNDIARVSQNNQSVNGFAARIESLIANLNDLQISEQGESMKEIIIKLNDQVGLNAFKRGLRESIKNVVLAARPKSFAEAIQIANEVEGATQTDSNNVMYFKKTNDKNRYSKSNNYKTNYSNNNYSNNNHNNYSNNNYRNNNGYGNNNSYNNNNNRYGNNKNNYNNRNKNHHSKNNQYNKGHNIRFVMNTDSGNSNVPGPSNPGNQEN